MSEHSVLTPFHASDQPLVNRLTAIIFKQYKNARLTEDEQKLVTIITESYGINPWISVDDRLPPEHVEVEVKNSNGSARLVRRGGLWYLPDFSMYVYYTPKYWRHLP